MRALQQLTGLLNGIETGRINARWVNSAHQYLIEHEEGIDLILDCIGPHIPYLRLEEIILPIWDGLCQSHPEMLEKFLRIMSQAGAGIDEWAKLAGHGPQPEAFVAVERHLAKEGEAQIEQLGKRACHQAMRRAIYSPDENPDFHLLSELLGRENSTRWLAVKNKERPLPWSALWAQCADPAQGVVSRAIEVLDIMLGHGVCLNDPSPDNAQCWALENLCHRYSAEPLAIEVLVEALLERGADTDGLTLGPQARSFLDGKIKSLGRG